MNPDELAKSFTEAGLDTPEKLAAFLRPAAISAQLADYDGQIAAVAEKRTQILGELQVETERLEAAREEARRKLQGEK